jgi:3-oxoacyl-[acyl-carrier protein] reductase
MLKNSVAVITGAGRINGIGASTAKLLAERGCNLVINTLKNKEQAESILLGCRQHGVQAELFVGDVSSQKVCEELAEFVKTKFGRADIIVHCVGVTKSASYEKLNQLNAEDFSRLFSVNATSIYLVATAFQDLLKASGNGVMVNVTSSAGISGKGSSIAYAASKGAANTLTLALAQALSPEVRVNAVCPSFVDSSWWEESFKGKEDKYSALLGTMKDNNLLFKVLKPENVASLILAIIQNPGMTGELIRLDAGAHIGKGNVR